MAIPRHTSPPSAYLARLVARGCGVPTSWATDLRTDEIVIDLPVTQDRAREVARAVLDPHGVPWEVRP